jgi:hypothetical protein
LVSHEALNDDPYEAPNDDPNEAPNVDPNDGDQPSVAVSSARYVTLAI